MGNKCRNIYEVKYTLWGVNFNKKVSAYDFGISEKNALTLYFNNNNGRMILPISAITNFSVVCIWHL